MNKSHLLAIDGLRALAALSVLVYHAYVVSGSPDVPFRKLIGVGWMGVDVFFTISGFVLFLTFGLSHQAGKKPLLKDYFKRRAKRIIPAYYFNVFGIVTLLNTSFWMSASGIKTIVVTLLFSQTLLQYTVVSVINGVLWTLCLEVQFYILLPFIYKLFVGNRWLKGLILFLIISVAYKLVVINIFGDSDSREMRQYLLDQLPAVITQFTIGTACAALWLQIKNNERYEKVQKMLPFLGLIGIILLLCCMLFISQYGGSAYWNGDGALGWFPLIFLKIGASIAAAVIILGICSSKDWVGLLLRNRVLVYLGVVSYGVYLWHRPVLGSILARLNPIDTNTKFLILCLLCILISVLWASVSYWFVERPFLNKRNSLRIGNELPNIKL